MVAVTICVHGVAGPYCRECERARRAELQELERTDPAVGAAAADRKQVKPKDIPPPPELVEAAREAWDRARTRSYSANAVEIIARFAHDAVLRERERCASRLADSPWLPAVKCNTHEYADIGIDCECEPKPRDVWLAWLEIRDESAPAPRGDAAGGK